MRNLNGQRENLLLASNLTAALWMAHDGPAWLGTIDYDGLPATTAGG
jgi:hypothetical protein